VRLPGTGTHPIFAAEPAAEIGSRNGRASFLVDDGDEARHCVAKA
jgi:hypothetical protein